MGSGWYACDCLAYFMILYTSFQSQSHGYSGGGREVHVLRQEVDDLRIQLSETKQHLDAEKMECEKVSLLV